MWSSRDLGVPEGPHGTSGRGGKDPRAGSASASRGSDVYVSHSAFTKALHIGSLNVQSRVWGKRCKAIKADFFR